MFFFLHNFWRNMSEKEIAAPSSTTRPWGILQRKNLGKKTCLHGVKRGARATPLKEKKWKKNACLAGSEARATQGEVLDGVEEGRKRWRTSSLRPRTLVALLRLY